MRPDLCCVFSRFCAPLIFTWAGCFGWGNIWSYSAGCFLVYKFVIPLFYSLVFGFVTLFLRLGLWRCLYSGFALILFSDGMGDKDMG